MSHYNSAAHIYLCGGRVEQRGLGGGVRVAWLSLILHSSSNLSGRNVDGFPQTVPSFDFNYLSGSLPTQLGALTALTNQSFDFNFLSGSLPTQLGALTALTYQSFENTYLSGSLPTQLGALTALTYQNLDFNILRGSLPTQLGALTTLTYQSLEANYLSGSLPTQLGALTALTYQGLDFNILRGSLPTQLGALTALTYQSLEANNRLSGSLPTQLGALTALTYQGLADNILSGSLPTQLGALTASIHLNFENNKLSGSLPTQLVALTVLENLLLQGSHLSGSLPTQLAQFCPEHGVSPRACLVLDCSVDATNNYRCALDALGWAPAPPPPPPPPPPSPHKPPLPPPLSPEANEAGDAQSQWVVWAAALLPLCMLLVAALVLLYRRYSHSLQNADNLRVSRDRANFDLQLLAHCHHTVSEPALTAEPSPVDQPVAPTSSQPVAPTFSRLAKSRGGTSCSSCTEGTNSELGRTIIASSSETAVTLSEVSGGAARLLLGRGRGRGGRPHHPYAASSVSSSKGTASTEANVHLLTTKEVDERYDLAFDLTAEITFAPVPQFGPPFLEVLSEADRAELLVGVGRDGRLVYASTGEPVVPSSLHSDSACTYMFVVLASGAIYIRVDDPLTFHHDLAGNAPVVAAGEMFFSDGRLLSINNRSGHYRPPPECLRIVLSLFRSKGVQIAVPFKEFHYDVTGIQNGVPGSERRRGIK